MVVCISPRRYATVGALSAVIEGLEKHTQLSGNGSTQHIKATGLSRHQLKLARQIQIYAPYAGGSCPECDRCDEQDPGHTDSTQHPKRAAANRSQHHYDCDI